MAVIRGSKGGSGGGDKGGNRGTEIASVAYMKILLALTEGEAAGDFTGKDIYLDGTPLLDDAGNENFPGVTWEWRSGTVDQDYIAGFPAVENEISVGTELKYGTPWVKSINNTQLSAVRLRLKFPNGIYKLRDSGGKNGYRIAFAIDISTDGGSYVEYGTDEADGIANAGYERSYRIDLPAATSGWQIRVRRLTENTTDGRHADISRIESMTDIVDAKLRYPHTSLLFVQFDAKLFDGRTPNVTVKMKGIIVRVPANYDPVSRTYSGIWDGTFKWAWTNNPAWIFYDLVLNKRYGLGKRITADLVDKWTLYQIAQYCDAPVSDGAGGKEARYLCDLYISQRTDAWTVLMDLANIFRGMISWSNNLLSVDADMPRELDPDFVFNKSNIVGAFNFSSTSEKTNYSSAIVTYSNPANSYQDDQASAWVPEISNRFGFNTIELSRIGCTRESEAQRHGLYAIETNRDDNGVEFKTGLEGRIPRIGKVIGINNAPLAGRDNGGRVAAVSGTTVTLDRLTTAKSGDTLIVNLPTGKSEGRKVKSVSGRAVTVETAYSITPNAESAWVLDQPDLAIQLFRVKRLMVNSDNTVTINGLPYNPNKFPRVDDGAVIEDRPVSVVPPRGQGMPENINISSVYRVEQGIGITTMIVTWDTVKNAVAYEAQWRQNNGDWINVPRTGNTRFEIDGIYAGRYVVRVRAINSQDIASVWSTSAETELTGKTGAPLPPLALTTTSLLHGVQLNWAFPEGSGDTQKTELQYSPNPNGNGAMALSDVSYPGKTYQQMGLQIAAIFWYRARIVDRIGNESPWTAWVQGMASDDIGEYYDKLTDAIKDTEAWQEAQRDIDETHKALTETADAIREEVTQQVDGQIEAVNKSITENINSVNQTLSDNITAVNKSITDAVSDINASVDQQITDVNKTLTDGDAALKSQLQAVENSLKQSIAQANTGWDKAVKQETADRIADVNAKAAQAADQLLNEKNERVAAIDNLQTIIQDGDESLARQISEISAGSGQQFDSFSIWYFDKDNEGWTEDDAGQVPMQITDDGWLKALNSTASCRSPNGQTIPASSYRTVMLRIKRVGNPAWKGRLYWIGTEETGWSDARSVSIAEQEFDGDGISVVAISDVNWNASGTVRRFRLDLAQGQNADNHFLIHWISVGRPAPAASTAALRNEEMARTQADEAEALKRSTLAAQIRGTTDSNSLADLRSGLLYQEMNARITADKAEVTARESLQTQFNENKSSVAEELSSLSTAQSAQASKISGLETSLGKKADATALQSLTQKVEQQGTTLTSQGNSLTSLSNRVGKTESGVAANSNAITGLQSSVSQQDKTLASQSQAITKLQNDLTTTNSNVSKKADQSALTSLTGRVEKTESGLTAANSNITSLNSSISAAKAAGDDYIPNPAFDPSYDRMGYDVVSSGAAGVPGDCPFAYVVRLAGRDHVPKINNIVVTPGDVFEMSALVACGAGQADFNLYIASGTSATEGVKARLSGGNTKTTAAWKRATWRFTVPSDTNFLRPFLQVNQSSPFGTVWYAADWHLRNVTAANRAQKTADATASAVDTLTTKVTQQGDTLSSIGSRTTALENGLKTTNSTVSQKADASAVQTLQNTVTQQGKDITAANSAITKLTSDLSTTNANVNKKADASALQTLQNTVTEQGKTLSSQGSSLTQLNNALSDTTASLAADGKIPGNLISNGSFERGQDAFTGWGSVGSVISAQSPNYGSKIAMCGVGLATLSQKVPVTKGNTYKIGVFARAQGGSVMQDQGNNKLRIGQSSLLYDRQFNTADLPTGSSWVELSGTWKATVDGMVDVAIYSSLKSGSQYFDDFYFVDVTDEVNIAANAGAISSLTTRVTTAEGKITSQGSSITKLTNDLATTNGNVNKKADATALTALTNRVTSAEGKLESQSSSITSLQNGLTTANQNIAKKADASAVTSLSNRVTEAEGKLTSQSNSITQLEASLDSARDTGENLVENYDFRNQLNAWNLQNAGRIVWGASSGDGSAGVTITHTGDASNPGLMSNNAKWFPVSSSRRFRFMVRARLISGSGGILCRIFNSKTAGTYTQTQAVVTRKDGFETLTVDIPALPATTTDARIAFYVYPSATVVVVDSIAVYDVTDETAGSANASAISDLTTRVTSAEGSITSQGAAITKLQSDLSGTNANVTKKADATALNALSNRVTQTEKDISSQADSITSLNSTLNINARKGSNPWLDGTFETYDANHNLGGSARVVSGIGYSGNKCMRVTRAPNTTGNSDDLIGSRLAIRDTAVFRVEFWAMMPAGENPSSGWVTAVGLNVQNDAGANSWLGAANVSESALAGRDKWVKFSGYAKATAKGATRAVVWISTRGANGSNTPGYNLYIDDLVITDVTDAYNAQGTADAAASAVDSLTTKVTQQGDTLSSIGSRTTALENGLKTTNSTVSQKADASAVQALQNTVTQQGKDITAANSAITKLTSDLSTTNANVNKKADASALQT
ncbi:TipJ family phage tail tip protein, partial [Klebsiella oxytoca]|uniref:TipJ family phage tail tip protein n=1 Tax=Klebsiella oxytoca TaxID=571 RepID=UPI001E61879D